MIIPNGISGLPDGRTATRMRFKAAAKFLAPLGPLFREGLATKQKNKTPLGRAMSHLLNTGFIGEFPRLEIDPAKVKLSDGNLVNPLGVQAQRQGKTIAISWIPSTGNRAVFSHWDDRIVVCAYSIHARTVVVNDPEAHREDGSTIILLPDELLHETVHLYLITQSRNKKRFSRNMYLGEFISGQSACRR